MDYKDEVRFYETASGNYGQDVLGDPLNREVIRGLLVQRTGFANNRFDTATADNQLFLPGDDEWLADNYLRLEGMVVSVSPFGADHTEQLFRVTRVVPARDLLLDAQVQHLELELTLLAEVEGVS